MQAKQVWPTRTDRTFAQACMESTSRNSYVHTRGFLDVGVVDVDVVADYFCGNMDHAQGRPCAALILGSTDCPFFVFLDSESTLLARQLQQERTVSAQELTDRTLIGHEPLICSKICFTKTELVQ